MPITRSNFDDVVHFHRHFQIDYSGPPRHLPIELEEWRVKFLYEELKEYEQAIAEKNLVKQFDALLDLAYVAHGNAHLQGLPWQKGWFQVHYANMMKTRHKDGEGRGVGDIKKPEGWTPPDPELDKLLKRYEEQWDKNTGIRG